MVRVHGREDRPKLALSPEKLLYAVPDSLYTLQVILGSILLYSSFSSNVFVSCWSLERARPPGAGLGPRWFRRLLGLFTRALSAVGFARC